MQVLFYFLDLKHGETIKAEIKSQVHTRFLVVVLIRDGCHWFEKLSTMAFSSECKLE